MPSLETVIRRQISRDEDCSDNAGKVLAMRAELNALIGERIKLAGNERPVLPPLRHRRHETKIARGH